MRIKNSTLLRTAVPLALGMLSMNASAAGPMSSYVPLKSPCLILDTGTDSYKHVKDGVEVRRYRIWAGKDKDDKFHSLKGQGGMDKCVNPMPGKVPTAVVLSISPRANNGARGNLAVYGDQVKSDDVFGKESAINFWNTNSTNTTIVRVPPDSPYIKVRAKLFNDSPLKVTGNVLGYFYANEKKHPWHVIHVAKEGGDFEDPITAVNSIKFSSIDSQWLVKIGPGNYDLGKFQMTMKPYVRIEGSGRHITKLFGDHGSDNDNDARSALVIGVDKGVLANLTIKNKGRSDRYNARIAVYNKDASPTFDNVRLFAHGTAQRVCGMSNYGKAKPVIFDSEVEGINQRGSIGAGFCNHDESEAELVDVVAKGEGIITGYGLYNAENSSPRLSDVHAIGSGVTVSRPGVTPPVRGGTGIGMRSVHFARPIATDTLFEGDVAFAIADNNGAIPAPLNGRPPVVNTGSAAATSSRIMNSVAVHLNRNFSPDRARVVDPFPGVGGLNTQCHNVVDLARLGDVIIFADVPTALNAAAALPAAPPAAQNPC